MEFVDPIFVFGIGLVSGALLGAVVQLNRSARVMRTQRERYEHLEEQAKRREREVYAFHEAARKAFEAGGTVIIRKPD